MFRLSRRSFVHTVSGLSALGIVLHPSSGSAATQAPGVSTGTVPEWWPRRIRLPQEMSERRALRPEARARARRAPAGAGDSVGGLGLRRLGRSARRRLHTGRRGIAEAAPCPRRAHFRSSPQRARTSRRRQGVRRREPWHPAHARTHGIPLLQHAQAEGRKPARS